MFIIQWLILQLRILKNRFKERKEHLFFENFVHRIVFIFGFVFLYFFLIHMFDFAAKRGMFPFDFACILLSFCLLVFLPLLAYSAVVCSLSFLFQKEEIAFYFSIPINRMQVFLIKFWQTFLHTTWMAFFGIFTFIVSLQIYFDLSPSVYLIGIISSLTFLLIPVCLAVIIVCLLSRFIPFIRAKGILTVIGLLVGSSIVLAIRLMRPERLVTPQGKMRLLTFLENLHKPWMTWLPSEWLTNIFAAHYHGDTKGIYLNFFILISTALILFIITHLLAKAFYVHIWSGSIAVPPVKAERFGWQILLKLFPPSLHMLIKKDLISFYRDTVERGSLLIFIPLAFLYLYSIHVLDLQLRAYPQEPVFSFLYLYLFNLFYSGVVICGLAGRWTFPSISAEGNNFKLIKLSPIRLEEFLQEKFWLGFLPLLILGEILVISSCFILGLRLSYTVIAFFITVILAIGVVTIAVILGARMADFSIREPLEFALSYKGFLYLVYGLLFIVAIILLVVLPLSQFLRSGISLSFILSSTFALIGAFLIFYYFYIAYKRAALQLKIRDV